MFHDDHLANVKADAALRARDELIRNVKAANNLIKMAVALGVDPLQKKIPIIKMLREQTGAQLKDAKDAVELAIELRAAA